MANLTILTPLQPLRRADIGPRPVVTPAPPQVVPLMLSTDDWRIVDAARSDTIPTSAYLFTAPTPKATPTAKAPASRTATVKGEATLSIGSAAKVKRVGTGYVVSGQLASGQIRDLGQNRQAEQAFARMVDGAAADGIVLTKVYGYRSIAEQRRLWRKSDHSGHWVARPGHSEHHTGLAFDIGTDAAHFGGSRAYKWMRQHAWEYGFVQSMGHEPWHWRYDPQAVRSAVAKARR